MATHDDPSPTPVPYWSVPRVYVPTPLPTGQEREALLRVINIYHPDYPNLPPLLSLHGSDGGGVHYSVAYYGCCIIAGNVWDDDEGRKGDTNAPYLSNSRDGPPIVVPPDDILREKEYYFHISKDQVRYPVIPSFDYWVFPDNMPKPWRSVKTSREDETRPGGSAHLYSCRITKNLHSIDYCRIVPLSARDWFNRNHMRQYTPRLRYGDVQDGLSNVNPLRTDIHHSYDASMLVFVPKPNPEAPGEYSMAVHVLRRAYESVVGVLELITCYHNRICQPFEESPIEYHFARFAWSLFADTVLQLFNEQNEDVSFSLLLDRDFKTPGVHADASGRKAVDKNGGFPKPRPRIPPPGWDEDGMGERNKHIRMASGEPFCRCGAGDSGEPPGYQ